MPPCRHAAPSQAAAVGPRDQAQAGQLWLLPLASLIGKRSQVWVVPGEIRRRLRTSSTATSRLVSNEKWLTDITEFQIPAGKVYSRPADQRGIFFVVAATGTFE